MRSKKKKHFETRRIEFITRKYSAMLPTSRNPAINRATTKRKTICGRFSSFTVDFSPEKAVIFGYFI